jgi:hypothetical protein
VATVLTAVAMPMMAACRVNSSLEITDIIDPAGTTVKRIDAKNFLVFFAVRSTAKVSFACNRNSACTPEGITYKPALSSNVAAALQTAECRAFQITVVNSGPVVAGFRIRFQEGLSPAKKTFLLKFDTSDPSKFILQSVNNPTDTGDL